MRRVVLAIEYQKHDDFFIRFRYRSWCFGVKTCGTARTSFWWTLAWPTSAFFWSVHRPFLLRWILDLKSGCLANTCVSQAHDPYYHTLHVNYYYTPRCTFDSPTRVQTVERSWKTTNEMLFLIFVFCYFWHSPSTEIDDIDRLKCLNQLSCTFNRWYWFSFFFFLMELEERMDDFFLFMVQSIFIRRLYFCTKLKRIVEFLEVVFVYL